MNNEKTNSSATDRLEKILDQNEQHETRLTKKGKLALALGSLALAGGLVTGYVSQPHEQYSPSSVSVVLEQGDTVWNLMNQIPGSQTADKREIYAEVKARNPNVDFNKPIPAGTRIELPSSIG